MRLGDDEGRAALLVDGVVQSISPADALEAPGYWGAMLPPQPARHALILGLGGATIAHLLRQRWGTRRIVGVERDLAVVETAGAAGWLDLPGLDVVQADAFAYVEGCREQFDYVALDLYRGERLDGRMLDKRFLRRVRDLLAPRGWMALNLFRDSHSARRVERIRRVFPELEEVVAQSNVVVQARRP